MPISDEELAKLPEKTKKHADVVQMYRDYDFLTAYAKHTDWRIENDGAKAAVGNGDHWEELGELQFAFLKDRGLKPEDRLTEIGCGTGRLARKVVPYLDEGRYIGVDLSFGAVRACHELALVEGWADKHPAFVCDSVPPRAPTPAFLWAFSVSVHLTGELWGEVVKAAAASMDADSQFFFTYVPEQKESRAGLKGWRHTLHTYRNACTVAGLEFKDVKAWKGPQRLARAVLA